jgi:hypothetical protein
LAAFPAVVVPCFESFSEAAMGFKILFFMELFSSVYDLGTDFINTGMLRQVFNLLLEALHQRSRWELCQAEGKWTCPRRRLWLQRPAFVTPQWIR